ncbi:metalloregulator ArsR/SmtB family transcription factor [Paenibacillus sp. LMG 31456]|uniref:Metalloregulator ArsR/SmtB family transcription factor n=1 Tax=Paenibacillus foliorum TaxID=2654974 RepID=A0A972H820_9BACL|nr:metalloregulator ArsR/SmtB family transcription factor [Paenibacillus foliorum]
MHKYGVLEKELCVCEIVEVLQTSQPNISQHMRKLKDGGLVKESKRGQWVYYSLTVQDRPYLDGPWTQSTRCYRNEGSRRRY